MIIRHTKGSIVAKLSSAKRTETKVATCINFFVQVTKRTCNDIPIVVIYVELADEMYSCILFIS